MKTIYGILLGRMWIDNSSILKKLMQFLPGSQIRQGFEGNRIYLENEKLEIEIEDHFEALPSVYAVFANLFTDNVSNKLWVETLVNFLKENCEIYELELFETDKDEDPIDETGVIYRKGDRKKLFHLQKTMPENPDKPPAH